MHATREPGDLQRAKSQRTHLAIVRAVVACLDRHGYADTSISRVLEHAGASRGALQHHFRTKEDLIAATAEYLMDRSLGAMRAPRMAQARHFETECRAMWRTITQTRDYRALLEILNAMRTDATLRKRIRPILKLWNRSIDEEMLQSYASRSGSDDEVIELMAMSRCLLRGLVIHESYADGPESIDAIVSRWIALLSGRLKIRDAA